MEERQWNPHTKRIDLRKRKNDSGNQRQRYKTRQRERDNGNNRQGELTKKRGGTTVEARDKKNGLKKENERQLTRKAEIMDKTARMKNRQNYNREN